MLIFVFKTRNDSVTLGSSSVELTRVVALSPSVMGSSPGDFSAENHMSPRRPAVVERVSTSVFHLVCTNSPPSEQPKLFTVFAAASS